MRLDAVSEFIAQLAQEIDDLREKVRALSLKPTEQPDFQDEIAKLREELEAAKTLPKAVLARFETANAKAERVLSDKAIEMAHQRASDITDVYQATWSMMSTFEMVIYAVSRSPKLQEMIDPGVAAAKLTRLIGFGAEYFQRRNHWTIENWVEHLAGINDSNMPGGGAYESSPVSEYTLNM
jgi:hypothetical protein